MSANVDVSPPQIVTVASSPSTSSLVTGSRHVSKAPKVHLPR
jgi:hypothetical protein